MSKPFYHSTDAELASGSTNVVSIVTPVPANWGLTPAQVTSYTALATNFNNLLALAVAPATRTPVAVQNKNAVKKLLTTASVNLSRIVTANPTVSNAQLLSLRLNMRTIPTPNPVPGAAPNLDVVSVTGFTAKLRLHDSTSGSKRGKPPAVSGASVFSHVGPTAPTDLSAWTFEGNTGRTSIDVTLPNTVPAGATVWFTAFWFNPRKQAGPNTTPISANLPGGGVGMAA